MKNNKSLTSSKPKICCEDHLIHLPTKLKKISRSSQDHKEDRIRGALFVKESKQRLYSLFINTNLYLQTIFLFNCLIFCNWEILCLQCAFIIFEVSLSLSHYIFFMCIMFVFIYLSIYLSIYNLLMPFPFFLFFFFLPLRLALTTNRFHTKQKLNYVVIIFVFVFFFLNFYGILKENKSDF